MSIGARLASVARRLLGDELHVFLAYAFIVFRPGAAPPKHPAASTDPPKAVPTTWTDSEYQLFIDEARVDMARQQEDKRDIRARAQITLTTAIAVGGIAVASYGDGSSLGLCGRLLYWLAAVAIVLAGLASGGVITAQSPIGAPNILALPHQDTGEVYRRTADEYAHSRTVGAETVAVLVTVLRDCVLALIVGSIVLAVAHIRG